MAHSQRVSAGASSPGSSAGTIKPTSSRGSTTTLLGFAWKERTDTEAHHAPLVVFCVEPPTQPGRVGEVGGVSLTGGLGPTGKSAQQQLQGRTEYGPRVRVDKGRARRRGEIPHPPRRREPPTPRPTS